MVNPMQKQLERFRTKKKFVSISRELIDAHRLDGFIVDFSDDLILLMFVYDFFLDGYKIVATRDVTAIKCGEVEAWQENILRSEAVVDDVSAPFAFDLSTWKAALGSLKKHARHVILENETPGSEIFLIGRIERLDSNAATLATFDPLGNWETDRSRIRYDEITVAAFDGNYLKMHTKYLRDCK
jgi:hypothetical protein